MNVSTAGWVSIVLIVLIMACLINQREERELQRIKLEESRSLELEKHRMRIEADLQIQRMKYSHK